MTQRFSRNQFFRFGLLQVWEGVGEMFAPLPKKTPRVEVDWLRPPGALLEHDFLDKCTKCDDCVKACPHFVIRKAGPELGEGMIGSPIVIPKDNPCLMCEGMPCIAACTTGALAGELSMGTAVVDEAACYMSQGQPCDYCMNDCPEKPKAIRVDVPGTAAEVIADRCTGCGKCLMICPANAIQMERA